jgi:microcystin-dependent protein
MATPFFVQSNTLYLAGSGVVIGATSITLTSLTDIYGNVLTMADFGTKGYVTLEPDTTNEEAATFTGITANANGTYTLTGVSTVLAKSPYTESSGLVRAHSGGTKVVISDSAAFWANIKAYMDGIAISGAPNATSLLQGLVQLPTTSQINAGTATGGTGAALAVTPDTLAASNYGIFLAAAPGMVFDFAGTSVPTGFLACDGSAVSRTTYATLFTAIGTAWGSGDGSSTFNVPDLRGRTTIGSGTGTRVYTFSSRSTNTITITGSTNANNNAVQTGQTVTYHSSSGVITGLTNDTVYYVIRVAYNQFQLASTLANAQNGTAIALSSDGSGTQTFTLTLSSRTVGDYGGEETHAMSSTELLAHTHTVDANAGTGSTLSLSKVGNSANTTSTSSSAGGNAAMNNMQPFGVITKIIKT